MDQNQNPKDDPLSYIQLNLCRDFEGPFSATRTLFVKHTILFTVVQKNKETVQGQGSFNPIHLFRHTFKWKAKNCILLVKIQSNNIKKNLRKKRNYLEVSFKCFDLKKMF